MLVFSYIGPDGLMVLSIVAITLLSSAILIVVPIILKVRKSMERLRLVNDRTKLLHQQIVDVRRSVSRVSTTNRLASGYSIGADPAQGVIDAFK